MKRDLALRSKQRRSAFRLYSQPAGTAEHRPLVSGSPTNFGSLWASKGGRMTDLGNYRILVAEDDFLLAADIAEALERAGACVAGPVASNNEALMLLDCGQIDGAVIDIGLRDGEAQDLVLALRRDSVPYVIVSGYEPAQFGHLGDQATFFEKPATADRVLGRLADQIRTMSLSSRGEHESRLGERRRAARV